MLIAVGRGRFMFGTRAGGTMKLAVADIDSPIAGLTLAGSSSNPSIVPRRSRDGTRVETVPRRDRVATPPYPSQNQKDLIVTEPEIDDIAMVFGSVSIKSQNAGRIGHEFFSELKKKIGLS